MREDLYLHHCPDCGRKFKSDTRAVTVCPPCLEKRRANIREIDSRYRSSEELGLLGSTTEIPTERYSRPHAAGRRIMRKEERQGG